MFGSKELSREENKSLKPYINKLKPLKAAVDKKNIAEGGWHTALMLQIWLICWVTKLGFWFTGQGAISWADLLVLAAKVATVKNWNR